MQFESLGLDPKILLTLERQGYSSATPIQAAAIPTILAGLDLMGCAQTGTGKTAAFALPIIHRLAAQNTTVEAGRPRRRTLRALILTPTRELANQIEKSFLRYSQGTGLRSTVVYGGVSQNPQVHALRAGADILIATPGRLLDLMDQGHLNLDNLQVLVLDEADQMMDMGFIQPLKQIVSQIPASRQTLMFSATMPPEIQRLATRWLRNPKTINASVQLQPPEKIKQSVTFLEQSQKTSALVHFLQANPGQRKLVFCRTKHGADRLVRHLERAAIAALAIHGNKSQSARERAIARFSSANPPVLVATDVAARGLHLPGISHVINFDLPETAETYVHRIGRTARAGASGESLSYCSSSERQYLRGIERLIGRALDVQRGNPSVGDTPDVEIRARTERNPDSYRRKPSSGHFSTSGHPGRNQRPRGLASSSASSHSKPQRRRPSRRPR